MAQAMGCKRWAIPEGYIPGWSHGPEPQMFSHEAVCLLNTSDANAHVTIMIYYSDCEPAGPLSDGCSCSADKACPVQ